jgi:hypothetical protein
MAAKQQQPELVIKFDGADLVMILDGINIARCQKARWMRTLPGLPGCTIKMTDTETTVEYKGVQLQPSLK